MTTKVELVHKGLGGPYTIKLNDTVIQDVEDIQSVNDGKMHRVKITLLVDNYTLRREEYTEEEKFLNSIMNAGRRSKKCEC